MAKISRKRFSKTRIERRISARVTISKGNVTGIGATFVACVFVGLPGYRQGAEHSKQSSTCDSGRNPRLALANAFAKLGQEMKWRGEHGRGAFARYC